MVVSDLRLPGAPGTELIKLAEGIPVLIMTSYASLRSAVDSMKMGAVDYIAKPFDHDEMLQAVARILRTARRTAARPRSPPTAARPAASAAPARRQPTAIGIIGSCAPMQELYSKIRKVAPTDSTVLIQGESGTGKELVARALHNLSKRAKAPLISVNCAAIPETLIESELFGHEKAPSPVPAPGAPGWSKRPTAAPCSSTRSANCRWRPRPACCAYCRKARSAGSARCNRRRSTCA